MATLKENVAAFQALNLTIPGVLTAPDPDGYPAGLTATTLPCAITLPGPARYYGGPGLGSARKSQRTYVLRYYLALADPNVAGPYGQALDLMEAVLTTLRDTASVNDLIVREGGATVVYTATDGLGDLGFLATIPYGGNSFYGFEVHVPCLEMVS